MILIVDDRFAKKTIIPAGSGLTGQGTPVTTFQVRRIACCQTLAFEVDVYDMLAGTELRDSNGDRHLVQELFETVAFQRIGEVRRVEKTRSSFGSSMMPDILE